MNVSVLRFGIRLVSLLQHQQLGFGCPSLKLWGLKWSELMELPQPLPCSMTKWKKVESWLVAKSVVLSGAFIPVSEDEGMIALVYPGHINLEKLEAMTAICSVGLDGAIPADTQVTIAAMIADEGSYRGDQPKTTAVRIIPYGKRRYVRAQWTSWVCSGNEGQQKLHQLTLCPWWPNSSSVHSFKTKKSSIMWK